MWRYQVYKWIMLCWQVLMDGFHYLVSGMRASNGKYIRVGLFNDVTLCTKAAGNDHMNQGEEAGGAGCL